MQGFMSVQIIGFKTRHGEASNRRSILFISHEQAALNLSRELEIKTLIPSKP